MATPTVKITSLPFTVKGSITVADVENPYTVTLNHGDKISFSHGTGAGQITKYHASQRVIPANGADTIDLAAGTIAGSETASLLTADNLSAFTLAKLNLFTIFLEPGGADSIKLAPGGANGFSGWMGGTTPFEAVWNGPDGGGCNHPRADSIGFTVDGTHKNLVISASGLGNATFTLVMGGN